MKKQFIVLVSLFSLLVTPGLSLAAKKPNFIPPGKLKIKIQGNTTSTLHTTSTPPRATSTPPIQDSKRPKATSTPPRATSTPRVVKIDFNLTGEIVRVNVSSSLLEVKIKTINHFSSRRDWRGKTVLIKVRPEAIIRMSGKNKNATLADLGPGQKATIKGQVENEQFNATTIVAAGKPVKAKGIQKFFKIFKFKK